MFFVERFFCYHHHDAPDASDESDHGGVCSGHSHSGEKPAHDVTWGGATFGLTVHSILAGVALGASVSHGSHDSWLAGFGTFLVIFLHKPFDAMMIGTLMARGGSRPVWCHTVNGLFALAIPVGVLLFTFGLQPGHEITPDGSPSFLIIYALAFSAGTFLCISLSDLLPELQFHQHDRVKLSLALLLGLGVAYVAGRMESAAHGPHPQPPASASSNSQAAIPGPQNAQFLPRFPDPR